MEMLLSMLMSAMPICRPSWMLLTGTPCITHFFYISGTSWPDRNLGGLVYSFSALRAQGARRLAELGQQTDPIEPPGQRCGC